MRRVPSGNLVRLDTGEIAVVLCTGQGAAPAILDLSTGELREAGHGKHGGDKSDQSKACPFAIAAIACCVAGPFAVRRVDTLGLHRNAITALVATMTPRMAARDATGDWRASPFAGGAGGHRGFDGPDRRGGGRDPRRRH